jgi:hypothetical protein
MDTYDIKHNTCPRCGGADVYENDISGSDISNTCYHYMYCNSCHKDYEAVYTFSHTNHDTDE